MKKQKTFHHAAALIFYLLLVSCNSHGQIPPPTRTAEPQRAETDRSPRVGGECEEGYCELMYFGMPKEIKPEDTSPGWNEKGQKLIVTGTVFKIDGRTPAPNVIIYYHQTDNDGYYSPRNDKPENQTRHGHIRGWVKTDANGKYTIKTIRPGPYPGREDPAHIHLIVKEPDIANEYWLDDLVFDDDKRLIPFRKKHPASAPRGGSGTLFPLIKGDVQIAEHDIILGLNIPNYPKKQTAETTAENFQRISAALDRTKGEFIDLPYPLPISPHVPPFRFRIRSLWQRGKPVKWFAAAHSDRICIRNYAVFI